MLMNSSWLIPFMWLCCVLGPLRVLGRLGADETEIFGADKSIMPLRISGVQHLPFCVGIQ